MDWIEQLFGLSPDGGNGSLEMLYIAVFVAIVLMIVFRTQVRAMLSHYLGRRDREQ